MAATSALAEHCLGGAQRDPDEALKEAALDTAWGGPPTRSPPSPRRSRLLRGPRPPLENDQATQGLGCKWEEAWQVVQQRCKWEEARQVIQQRRKWQEAWQVVHQHGLHQLSHHL